MQARMVTFARSEGGALNVVKAIVSWFFGLYAVAALVFLVLAFAAGHPPGLAFSEALAGPADLIVKTFDWFGTAVTGRAVMH